MTEPTIGQAFASRWLSKNYGQFKDWGQPEDLFGEIVTSVDNYTAKKEKEFRTRLRDVVLKAADGESSRGEITVSYSDMLEYEELVWVARRRPKNMSPVLRFPT